MINIISEYDRKLGLEVGILRKKIHSGSLKNFNKANNYLTEYSNYYHLSIEGIISAINKFSIKYLSDIQSFKRTGKFPYQLGNDKFDLSRIEYDVFLMSSFLFTEHRFSMLHEIARLPFIARSALSIGVGSGIELEFIKEKAKKIVAYDKVISSFPKIKHPFVKFVESKFKVEPQAFDIIFAIELIEHLHEPYELVKNIYDSLVDRGLFVVTTIKNVPQFDHLYNFKSSSEFENKMEKIGFRMKNKIVIPHKYLLLKINANNIFYVFRKS